VLTRLSALDEKEMRELVEDAWRMVVPRSVAAAYESGVKPDPGNDADHDPGD
jgi:hypothetical protein